MTTRRRVLAAVSILAVGAGVTACGSEEISPTVQHDQPNIARGAELFSERCAGCHTLDVDGAQGGATKVTDRERVDGPNFNVRRETHDSVLYAIRNGGFSGAIMPENIVVGRDADDIAAFLAKYAGRERKPEITPQQPAGGGNANGGSTTTPTNTQTQQNTTTTTPEAGTTSTPEAGTTSTPEAGTTSTPAGGQQANAQGKQIFTQNCGSCHTLKDAGTSGTVGPNLDDLKPDTATVQRQVTNGGGPMPAFKGQLSDAEIQAVSQYVSSVAGK
jgi:mono/diheme cytochrome c family protein